MMSNAEVVTILICFLFNSYRNFMHYYQACVCVFWKDLLPDAVLPADDTGEILHANWDFLARLYLQSYYPQ